ncbi:MAG: class I SAM-dependent DNA methyltransferase [Acidimicrobiales bacterium]
MITNASLDQHAIYLPASESPLSQDEEWCELDWEGERRRIRFHDYASIYAIPGLYEQVFYDLLECASPETVCGLLAEQMAHEDTDPAELVVLELGAGNGMVGECLTELGVRSIVGVDIVQEAADAAKRDRPDVYDDYVVADISNMEPQQEAELAAWPFNCLVSVAALGFGDIPPCAFAAAYNLVAPASLVAFNLNEEFLGEGDGSGFAGLVDRMVDEDWLAVSATQRYRHRFSLDRQPIHYVTMVGSKCQDVPLDCVE